MTLGNLMECTPKMEGISKHTLHAVQATKNKACKQLIMGLKHAEDKQAIFCLGMKHSPTNNTRWTSNPTGSINKNYPKQWATSTRHSRDGMPPSRPQQGAFSPSTWITLHNTITFRPIGIWQTYTIWRECTEGWSYPIQPWNRWTYPTPLETQTTINATHRENLAHPLDFKLLMKGFHKWPEWTTTLPSGWHLGFTSLYWKTNPQQNHHQSTSQEHMELTSCTTSTEYSNLQSSMHIHLATGKKFGRCS